MDKEKSIEKNIESIKIIERQIKFFEKNKPYFWQKEKIVEYNNRIKMLEISREYLCKNLEYKMNN